MQKFIFLYVFLLIKIILKILDKCSARSDTAKSCIYDYNAYDSPNGCVSYVCTENLSAIKASDATDVSNAYAVAKSQ